MASVVGKTIFSDGKGKLFFGYYKDNDAVEFVDYKTWKKLNFKDVSKGDTNKQAVIKAIVRNQKQFNKKVDFNMWAKKQKRSFEDTMDWFIKNGWVSNITKRGIKEGVEDVLSINEGIGVVDERPFGKKGIIIVIDDNGKKVSAIFKDKKNADLYNRNKTYDVKRLLDLAKKVKFPKAIDESINEAKPKIKKSISSKEWRKTPKYNKHIGMDGTHYLMKYDDKIGTYLQAVRIEESVNEAKAFVVMYKVKKDLPNRNVKPTSAAYSKESDAKKFLKSIEKDGGRGMIVKSNVSGMKVESASKEAMGIAALTGTRGSAVQDFIDKNRINSRKLFNALKKANLQGRINFASALSGKPGNPNAKLTIKLFGEDKKQIDKVKKQVGNKEIKFYDALSKIENKLGSKYTAFLDKALKDYKENPSKYKTNADKEEKLFDLS